MLDKRYYCERTYRMSVAEEALIAMYRDGELEKRVVLIDGEKRVIYHSKNTDG